MSATPPGWAESLLQAVVTPAEFENVSGDLLEQYRDSIHPRYGPRADWWYLTQVFGFIARSARVWAALFGAAFVTRTALDWLAPPADFSTRATVSTYLGVGILCTAGVWASWRSGSIVAGTVAGVATTVIGAIISLTGAAVLLAIWHDAPTLAAIDGSGGLGEVLTLPLVMVVPGALLGTIGGIVGAASRHRAAG
jgi:hypothetical protein